MGRVAFQPAGQEYEPMRYKKLSTGPEKSPFSYKESMIKLASMNIFVRTSENEARIVFDERFNFKNVFQHL